MRYFDDYSNEITAEEYEKLKHEEGFVGPDKTDETLSVDELLMSILITNMRLYDVQMALLSLKDEKLAARLNDKHQSGAIIGSMPSLKVEE